MATKGQDPAAGKGGVSKMQLAIGAASLFLFIVGLKRTFQAEDGPSSKGFDNPQTTDREERVDASRTR